MDASENEKCNQLKKYLVSDDNIETITQIGPHGNAALHVTSFHGHNEVFQLFITNRAFESLTNTLSDFEQIREIRRHFLKRIDFT